MDFIRKNTALAVGIGLPLAVVVFFAFASIVPTLLVAPPQYDALFAVRGGAQCCDHVGEIKFLVSGGHLKAYWRKKPKEGYQETDTQLFLFDAKTLSVREISLPPLSPTKDDEWQEFAVPDTEALMFDPTTTSPDGYQFRDDYRNNGELWPFFVGDGGREDVFLGKDGREVRLSLPDKTYAYSERVHFLGWVKQGRVSEARLAR